MGKRPLGQTGEKRRSNRASAVIHYDANLFELSVNGAVVKQLDIRAKNQIAILTAFEEEGWPYRIDDPLHPNGCEGKARLRFAIHCLNGHQHAPIIRFFADGTGHGIRWKLIPKSGRRHRTGE